MWWGGEGREGDIVLIHSSINGYLDCFPILTIINSASMNIGIHMSFQISVFIFWGGGVNTQKWSCSITLWCVFSVLRTLCTVTATCTSLQAHPQCAGVPFSLCPQQYLLFLVLLIRAILTGVKWCLIVVLISFP